MIMTEDEGHNYFDHPCSQGPIGGIHDSDSPQSELTNTPEEPLSPSLFKD